MGIAFNDGAGFQIGAGGQTAPARFLVAGQTGAIFGWQAQVGALAPASPNAPTAPNPVRTMSNGVAVIDRGGAGAFYTGLALLTGSVNRLYAARFGAGVDVFDDRFNPVTVSGGFADPNTPAELSPYNIQAIGGLLYVAYAKKTGPTTIRGAGLGMVNAFDTDGRLVRRVASGGVLNAPWGMALAPANFGGFSNTLLVANGGDGLVNAFDPVSGALVGALKTADGLPIVIDRPQGLAFGNGLSGQSANSLFFAAAPMDFTEGQFGRIDLA